MVLGVPDALESELFGLLGPLDGTVEGIRGAFALVDSGEVEEAQRGEGVGWVFLVRWDAAVRLGASVRRRVRHGGVDASCLGFGWGLRACTAFGAE